MTSKELAWKIRRHGIEMTHRSHASHIGAILSVADIVAVLYNDVMAAFPKEPKNDFRDRFILSKGHAGAAVYAALAETGFFPIKALETYYADGSIFSGHVSHKEVPGVEFSTGSLGHGICVGAGMALAAQRCGKKYRVFVVAGDGECNEGSVWETALFANHFRLSNFIVIVDRNGLQGLGQCEDVLALMDLPAKWRAFGWNVVQVNGHDHNQLKESLIATNTDRPTCVIASTVKGRGVSFMENQLLWHYRDPQGEFYERAVAELEASRP